MQQVINGRQRSQHAELAGKDALEIDAPQRADLIDYEAVAGSTNG